MPFKSFYRIFVIKDMHLEYKHRRISDLSFLRNIKKCVQLSRLTINSSENATLMKVIYD